MERFRKMVIPKDELIKKLSDQILKEQDKTKETEILLQKERFETQNWRFGIHLGIIIFVTTLLLSVFGLYVMVGKYIYEGVDGRLNAIETTLSENQNN